MSAEDADSTQDAYPISLELVGLANELSGRFPRQYAHLAQELRQAATAVPRDLERESDFSTRTEQVRKYRRAECSVAECATLLSTAERLQLGPGDSIRSARATLARIVTAILRRVRRLETGGSGH